jgi:hypothetical protein
MFRPIIKEDVKALNEGNNNKIQTCLFGNQTSVIFGAPRDNNIVNKQAQIIGSGGLFSNNNSQNNNNNYEANKCPLFGCNQNYNNNYETNKVNTLFGCNQNYNNNNYSIFQNNFLETLKDEYHSKIKSNKNNTFDVTIKNLTNIIEINACYQDEFRKNDYIRKYNFNELKYIKYLSLCDTIDEMYEELTYQISKNTPIIYENNYNEINISIPICHSKYKDISFTLNSKIKTENEVREELYDIIADIQKKFKNFESEKKDLLCSYKKGIDELKQSISFYCEQVNKENKKYKDMCQKNEKMAEKVASLEKEISILKAKNI